MKIPMITCIHVCHGLSLATPIQRVRVGDVEFEDVAGGYPHHVFLMDNRSGLFSFPLSFF